MAYQVQPIIPARPGLHFHHFHHFYHFHLISANMQIPFSLENSASPMETLSLEGGDIFYYPGFLDAGEADESYTKLATSTPWQQDTISFGGKPVLIPRLQAWYGDKNSRYGYSGLALNPLPWTPLLSALRSRVEDAVALPFNSALVNYYRNGQDSVAWHSDDEKELGSDPVIASLSLGATRRFDLRHRQNKGQKFSCELAGGSLLVMGSGIQHNWQHQVPKQPIIEKGRINLTFRWVKPDIPQL